MVVGIRATNGYCENDDQCVARTSGKDRSQGRHGTQVFRLDTELGTIVEANTTLSTQLAEAFLLLGSQQDLMETREKAFEERIETLRDKVLVVTEEFQEQTRSLDGEILLLKQAMMQGIPSTSDLPPIKMRVPKTKPFGGA